MRTADDGQLMRSLLHTILQALVDAEATEHIGAGMHEQNDTRTTQRNGTGTKVVSTTSGDLSVKIAKTRTGSFFPSLLYRLLNEQQLAVLQWIAGGRPERDWPNKSHKITVVLQNCGLVKVSRKDGRWSATITQDGEYYVANLRYSSRRARSAPELSTKQEAWRQALELREYAAAVELAGSQASDESDQERISSWVH